MGAAWIGLVLVVARDTLRLENASDISASDA